MSQWIERPLLRLAIWLSKARINRLMDLCRTTGCERSPYLGSLMEEYERLDDLRAQADG